VVYPLPEAYAHLMDAEKTHELTLEQINSVRCPTCGVAAGEVCELHTGAPSSKSHEARAVAADIIRIVKSTGKKFAYVV
jgi:hypothetical protein